MDTIRVQKKSSAVPVEHGGVAANVLLISSVALAVGVVAGVNFLAGLGLAGMVFSVLYLRDRVVDELGKNKSLRCLRNLSRVWRR